MLKDMGKLKIGISSCLLGQPVRYDGGHKRDPYIVDKLGRSVLWRPVCPEHECGLSTPREPMRLEKRAGNLRIVTINPGNLGNPCDTGMDHTDMLFEWIEGSISGLGGLCGFIFKARSPSCGIHDAEIFDKSGALISSGPGLFARAFMERYPLVPVVDEESLHAADRLGDFIARARYLIS